jgi:hypothetical protein
VPLARIDAPTADPALLAGLGEAVRAALVEAIGIPPDDRFQVLQGEGATRVSYDRQYLGVQRDDGFALVQVFLWGGRTDEQNRAESGVTPGAGRRRSRRGRRPRPSRG